MSRSYGVDVLSGYNEETGEPIYTEQRMFNSDNRDQVTMANSTNLWNLYLQKQAQDWNVEQWERENEYNSPSNQLSLYEAAGLNPIAYLSQLDSTANSAAQSVSPGYASTPSMNTQGSYQKTMSLLNGINSISGQLGQFFENRQRAAQTALLERQADKVGAETDYQNLTNSWFNKVTGVDVAYKESMTESQKYYRTYLTEVTNQCKENELKLQTEVSNLKKQGVALDFSNSKLKDTWDKRMEQATADIARNYAAAGLDNKRAEQVAKQTYELFTSSNPLNGDMTLMDWQKQIYRMDFEGGNLRNVGQETSNEYAGKRYTAEIVGAYSKSFATLEAAATDAIGTAFNPARIGQATYRYDQNGDYTGHSETMPIGR